MYTAKIRFNIYMLIKLKTNKNEATEKTVAHVYNTYEWSLQKRDYDTIRFISEHKIVVSQRTLHAIHTASVYNTSNSDKTVSFL